MRILIFCRKGNNNNNGTKINGKKGSTKKKRGEIEGIGSRTCITATFLCGFLPSQYSLLFSSEKLPAIFLLCGWIELCWALCFLIVKQRGMLFFFCWNFFPSACFLSFSGSSLPRYLYLCLSLYAPLLHVINYVKFFFSISCSVSFSSDNLLFADVLCYGFATYFLHDLFHLILSANANPYWR